MLTEVELATFFSFLSFLTVQPTLYLPHRFFVLLMKVGAEAGIVCEPCNGTGWLVCDFCNGQKTNVKAENNKRIYRRCPSCKAVSNPSIISHFLTQFTYHLSLSSYILILSLFFFSLKKLKLQVGYVLCSKCKVFKCVTFPNFNDSENWIHHQLSFFTFSMPKFSNKRCFSCLLCILHTCSWVLSPTCTILLLFEEPIPFTCQKSWRRLRDDSLFHCHLFFVSYGYTLTDAIQRIVNLEACHTILMHILVFTCNFSFYFIFLS